MKFLTIGDPHFKKNNIVEVEKLVEKLVLNTSVIQPDFVVIMGDILDEHEKAYQCAYQKALNLIEQLSDITIVYLLIGNHDYINASQFQTDNHFFNALKKWNNVRIIDTFTIYKHVDEHKNEYTFGFCPYVPNGRFLEALNSSGECWELCDCIFAHQEFKGCKMESITSKNGDEWSEDFPLVISGHIHQHQILAENIFYTGSIMQHGYSDFTDKYLWLFEFSTDENNDISYIHKGIDLQLKKKKKIQYTIDEFKNVDVSRFQNFQLKLELSGTKDEIKNFKNSKTFKDLKKTNITPVFNTINIDAPILKKGILCKDKGYLEIFEELCRNEKLDDVYDVIIENVK